MTPGAGPFLTPGARLAGFKEGKIWQLMTPGAGPFLTTGARLAGFKEDHYTLLHTKHESSEPVVLEKKSFRSSHDAPGAVPVWTPGVWLAGFIKRTTMQCYTQNMKALGLVVLEKTIFYVFPIVSLWELFVAMETRVPI